MDIEAVETYDLMSQGNFVCTVCGTMPSNLKGYAPIWSKIKPILTPTAKKFKVNMISAITKYT